jgi:hypothetical protein
MSNPIVAGIINLKTGEITDTTTLNKEKTAIRLKVRNELGCKHGRGDFMAFEFGTMCSMDYYSRQMINKCPSAFRGLQILSTKYRIAESNRYVERTKVELELAESVSDECAALYQSEENKNKLTYISELTESGIHEAKENLDDAKSTLNSRLRALQKLIDLQSSDEKTTENQNISG